MERTASRATTLICATAFLALPGCGVVFGGTSQNVSIASSPDAARVTVEPHGQTLTTPTVVSLSRDRDYVVTFDRDGYDSREVTIKHNLRGAVLAGDILLGLVGLLVDGLTGAWFELEPARIDVTLTRTAGGEEGAVDGPREIRVQGRIGGESGDVLTVQAEEPVHVRIRPRD